MEDQNKLPMNYPGYSSLPGYYIAMPSSVDESDNHNSTSPPEVSAKDPSRNIATTACLPCRTKHLKCEGQVGVRCARCVSLDLECSWVKSRRGYRRRAVKDSDTRQTISPAVTPAALSYLSTNSSLGLQPLSPVASQQELNIIVTGETALEEAVFGNCNEIPARANVTAIKERCLEAYFHYFSAAHPFLPPRPYLLELLRTKSLTRLEAAIRYVGSSYVQEASRDQSFQETTNLLLRKDVARDGFTVQAMLLLAIGLDGNSELQRASEVLTQAQDIALEIGMQLRDFAVLNGEGSLIMEECWRRTWWELYVVDGMIAGVHQQSSFRLNEISSNVLLPCEEREYILGQIPTLHSIEEFDDQSFTAGDMTFSSFAYRIAAIRNMGRILRLQQITFQDDPIIDQTDAHLFNWSLHLPESKSLAVDEAGQLDEMLFQAQMITNACSINLHRPYSQLDTTVARNVNSCAPYKHVTGGQIYNIHAAKVIAAANEITKLVTLPVPLVRHTHFFTCVITLASIVHLSCWASLLPLSQDDHLKQQIRLNTGALKVLAEVWPSATRVGAQVKGVAQEVFASRKLASEERYWGTFTDEEMMRSLVEDEVIINGI